VGAESTFAKGALIDRYEVRDLIGEGGMGAIYRAVDTKIGRTVALKVVRADRLDSTAGEQVRQRFLREALAISKVDHRNVVRVFDFGFSGETPYLAMEYLRGRDLGKRIKEVKASADFLPISEVVDVMLSVCAAVRACHDVGIIHRDLKPSNVFLCEGDSEPVVKILDFGVSKAPMASDLTREGQIVGTPQYLAPEQIDGMAVPQTDQYAIGVMLYMCLTKSLPYQKHGSIGLLRAIVLGRFAPPRTLRAELPEKLEAIILRALRTAPEERFESVHAMGRALWEFASPGAREQWRSYYFDNRPSAPPKASTHAMPLIEALARGLPPPKPPTDSLAFAPTAGAPAVAEKANAVAEKASAADRTTTEAPAAKSGPAELETPASKPVPAALQTPATVGDAKVSGNRSKRSTMAPLIVAGALALAVAAWLTLGRPKGEDSSKQPEPVTPAAAVAPAPPPPAAVAPAAPAPPAAIPAPRQTQPPRPANEAPAPAPPRESAPQATPSPRPEKRHRRGSRRQTPERRPDDVPIMP
jgi:serine/threonine protein kinase